METTATTQNLVTIDKEKEQKQLEIAESKRGPWGQLGVSIAQADFALQLRAQQSLAKLITPKTIEEVVQAEKVLKEVKAEGNAISLSRKEITNPVNKRLEELMLPEKSFAEPIKKVEDAIIAIKKADQEKKRKENEKLDAMNKCKEMLVTHRNNADAAFKSAINERISKAYAYALDNITLPELQDFIVLALAKYKEADFAIGYPKNIYPNITDQEYLKLCTENITLATDAKGYLAIYENELRAKFSDYEVVLNNKAEALRQAEADKVNKATEIATQANNANVAAKLDTMAAVTPTITSTTKALKQSYAVDMDETVENAIAILTAFTAHIDLCMPKLNVSKWFSFTPAQASVALSKVKNDNNDFKPVGITFKTVDKL